MKRHEKYKIERDRTFFIRNGGILLEELIAFCHRRSNPICHFSQEELKRATNYYKEDQIFVKNADYRLYKGSLKNRRVFVKKYHAYYGGVNPYKDIIIGSQMSVHKNALKILGCCLETEQPITVYEYVGSKHPYECISVTNVEPLSWKWRLKVARDFCHAIAYLHTAFLFLRPVIHRDIKSSNIMLDEKNVPKLMDFGLCISIPEGKSRVGDEEMGAGGYLAPQYLVTGYVTEKADVYSFGMLLFELLSGKRPYFLGHNVVDNGNSSFEELSNAVDCRITNEIIEQEQFLEVKKLLRRCISLDEGKRPTMIEVAKELRQIYESISSPS